MKSLFKKGAESHSAKKLLVTLYEAGKEYLPQIMELGSEIASSVAVVEAIKRSPKAAKKIEDEASRRAKEIDANTNKKVHMNAMDKFTVTFPEMWPVYAWEGASWGLGISSTTMSYTRLAGMTAIAVAATRDTEMKKELEEKAKEIINWTKEPKQRDEEYYEKLKKTNRETKEFGKRIIAFYEPFSKTLMRCTKSEFESAMEHASCELAEHGAATLTDIFDCIDGDLSSPSTGLVGWDNKHAYRGSLINYCLDVDEYEDEPVYLIVWDYEPMPVSKLD